ncbi:Rrf2 family transcriptional regulator [Pseudaminobacter salicylatoxidans]|uniref:Rrf2 family transcriptional regulator n=1 Tax=Pseudaminobacter salicylatoxidans TaxID=93369 RepID=UPI0002F823F8|nr:Rrf2 family transcriptional regulator [Pseudaminobacter salicylatoxidans]
MSANSRLTVAVHILSWMTLVARTRTDPVTSERIALSVNTNSVVIRRTLGLLQKAGLVRSHRGVNAGWTLTRSADSITLREVLVALGEGGSFALHPSTPNAACPIGRGIQPVLSRVYGALDEMIERQLEQTTIEQLLEETLSATPEPNRS